jgi:hypothetical protein
MSLDVMLDLETLSSAPDAAIVAIGACVFRTDGKAWDETERPTFYRIVNAESAQAMGGRIDASTVKWWARQLEEPRRVLNDERAVNISVALAEFSVWLQDVRPSGVWGNGSDFDNVVLRSAWERNFTPAPWSRRQNRCYRTLKTLRPDIAFQPYGVAHNALDDAIAQAMHAERIFAALAA